jgi:hypothetical protein
MDTQELMNIANQAISESTGKYLTDLQSDLLKASCENQTYEQFARYRGYCLDYIKKDVGSMLWHLLSEALGEKVTKKSFRQALERYEENKKFRISSISYRKVFVRRKTAYLKQATNM